MIIMFIFLGLTVVFVIGTAIYLNRKKNQNGFYPTVTVRQLMWAIRMKPMKKERWETVFDRKEV